MLKLAIRTEGGMRDQECRSKFTNAEKMRLKSKKCNRCYAFCLAIDCNMCWGYRANRSAYPGQPKDTHRRNFISNAHHGNKCYKNSLIPIRKCSVPINQMQWKVKRAHKNNNRLIYLISVRLCTKICNKTVFKIFRTFMFLIFSSMKHLNQAF